MSTAESNPPQDTTPPRVYTIWICDDCGDFIGRKNGCAHDHRTPLGVVSRATADDLANAHRAVLEDESCVGGKEFCSYCSAKRISRAALDVYEGVS